MAGKSQHWNGDASPSIFMYRQWYWPRRTDAMHLAGKEFRRILTRRRVSDAASVQSRDPLAGTSVRARRRSRSSRWLRSRRWSGHHRRGLRRRTLLGWRFVNRWLRSRHHRRGLRCRALLRRCLASYCLALRCSLLGFLLRGCLLRRFQYLFLARRRGLFLLR